MRVLATNKEYTGPVGIDHFVDGVCEHATETQRWYYKAAGYTIEDGNQDTEPDANDQGASFDDAPEPNEGIAKWRGYLTANGVEFPADAKKSELIELWENHS